MWASLYNQHATTLNFSFPSSSLGTRHTWTREELDIYEAQEFKIAVNQNVIETAHMDGKIEGETTKAIEIAKTMLAEGFEVDTIAKITKLTPKEIENLK